MWMLLGCVRPPLPAAPVEIPGADLLWHDLEGSDRIDLLESCASQCPRDGADRPVASLTLWSLDWTWMRGAGDPCEIAGTTVDLSITVTLPRWTPPADADPELVAEWATYLAALRGHEQGHVELIRELADAVAPAVRAGGCEGARPAGLQVLDEIRTANQAYDETTGSGRLQGADFWRTEGRQSNLGSGVAIADRE